MRSSWIFGLALVACNGGEATSPYADGSLEIPSVQLEDDELTSSRRDLGGEISVTGDGSNLMVKIDTDNGRTSIEVKSPGLPDLSALNGIAGQLSLAEDPLSDELSLLVSDATGPVYLLEPMAPTVLTSETFGAGFAELGSDLGSVAVGLDSLTLYSVFFATDEGSVEVFPGEPIEAVVGGVAYRIVVLAAWERVFASDSDPQCDLLEEIMAYEVSRVEAGSADLTPLIRPEGAAIEGPTCTP